MTLKRTQTGAFGKKVVLDTRNITLLIPRLLGENAGGDDHRKRNQHSKIFAKFLCVPKKNIEITQRVHAKLRKFCMDPLRDLNVFFGDTKKFSKYLTVSHMFICFWEKQADVSDFLCKLDVHAKSIDHFWKPCLAKFKRQIEQQLQQSSGIFRSPMCRYPELFWSIFYSQISKHYFPGQVIHQ